MFSSFELKRQGAAGVLAFTLALCLADRVSAGRQPVDCIIEAGFGGLVPSAGAAFPVAVTIHNTVASSAGVIEITQPDHADNVSTIYALPINSAAPSTKRFVLPVRAEAGRDLDVTVRFDSNLENIRQRVKVQRVNDRIVLVVGVPRRARPTLEKGEYAMADVSRLSLPDDPAMLDGVYGILLAGVEFERLSAGQLAALRLWTAVGGLLVFHDPPAEETFQIKVRGLGLPDATFLEKPGVQRLGFGRVASTGMNPLPDGSLWRDAAFSGRVFPSAGGEVRQQASWQRGLFGNFWRVQRTFGGPHLLAVTLILGLYLAVIWPLDGRLVRRFRRPVLTWALFPVSIAMFSWIAYGYSSFVNVGAMRQVRATVVDAAPALGTARVQSLLWVYSARNDTYTIEADGGGTVLSAREISGGVGRVASARVLNGSASRVSARIPVYSARQFDAVAYATWPHTVTVHRDSTGRLRVALAASLRATRVLLTRPNGFVELEREGDEWIVAAPETETSYGVVMSRLAGKWQPYYGRSTAKSDDLMPSAQSLADYLVLVSVLPAMPEPALKDLGSNTHMVRNLDAREVHLGLREPLKDAEALLILLEQGSLPATVRIAGAKPDTAEMTLVRVPIATGGRIFQ